VESSVAVERIFREHFGRALAAQLGRYDDFHAARADLLRRLAEL
jgi:hypothetical protein